MPQIKFTDNNLRTLSATSTTWFGCAVSVPLMFRLR